jgi:hypothetical protein
MSKVCEAADGTVYVPSRSYPPGTVLRCTITLFLERETGGLSITDIVAGGGRWPDTETDLGEPAINQHNRQEYGPLSIGTLPAGSHQFQVLLTLPSNLGCYRSLVNEVHLDREGVAGHLATARTSFSVNCTARPSAGPA